MYTFLKLCLIILFCRFFSKLRYDTNHLESNAGDNGRPTRRHIRTAASDPSETTGSAEGNIGGGNHKPVKPFSVSSSS